MSAATFRCGDPRTPDNTWGRGKWARCKKCIKAKRRGERTPTMFKGDGVTTWRSCGHPLTPENSWGKGKYKYCATCQHAACERYRKHGPLNPRRQRPRLTAQPDYSDHPSVAAYRLEKARRAVAAPTMPAVARRERSIPRYWRGAAA